MKKAPVSNFHSVTCLALQATAAYQPATLSVLAHSLLGFAANPLPLPPTPISYPQQYCSVVIHCLLRTQ